MKKPSKPHALAVVNNAIAPTAQAGTLKTDVIVQPGRIRWSKRNGANPIRGLTFEKLTRQLESFAVGYIADLALTWDTMERRDMIIKSVAAKRKKDVSRWGYEIHAQDDSTEARAHKEALEFFYNNLVTTSSFDENNKGGIALLVRQMLDCIGKFYSVHEIVWKPGDGGVSAELRFVPLWFFENTTGRLRYLSSPGLQEGAEMFEGEWLVCAGDGLMEATGVAYLFKSLPLKDWLIYCERHGMPGIRGKTSATKGSPEWNAMKDAVQNFASEFAAVMSENETIEAIDVASKGELPYPKMIEYLDRGIASLWRGSDLGTISSSAQGTGASVQGTETDLIACDDAALVSEALQMQIDRHVIAFNFGAGTKPLAYFKLSEPTNENPAEEIKIDQALVGMGAPVAKKDLYERYGRRQPDAKDEVASAPAPASPFGNVLGNSALVSDAQTVKLIGVARDQMARAQARIFAPIRERLAAIANIEDPAAQREALVKVKKDLPALLKRMNLDPDTAKVFEDTLAAALINGAVAV